MTKIAPSILSADFTRLGEEIASINSADWLHFDVMDGVFVPNISIGLPVLESVRKATDMPLDVHLMISAPTLYSQRFALAGADIVVFHAEAEPVENIETAISALHGLGKKAGLAIKPATEAEVLFPFIDTLDLVLIMTVEPGFGGQTFMPEMLPKISRMRSLIDKRGLNCAIEVDGGINAETAGLCIKAGADILVAGSYVFNKTSRAETIRNLRNS